jgi:hypothetical protein
VVPKWLREHHGQEHSGPGLRSDQEGSKRKGRSLNAEIIKLLEAEAADANRRIELRRLGAELDRFAASLPPMEDSTPLIRRGRDEH